MHSIRCNELAYSLLYSTIRANLFILNSLTYLASCGQAILDLSNVSTVYKDSSITRASLLGLTLANANVSLLVLCKVLC